MTAFQPRRIPVSVVTGFLGSGKTTLIANILKRPDMAGTAVVVNEFGEVGLDNVIFADTLADTDIRLLANGCMCCVAGSDLVRTLLDLIRAGPRPPSRIVIETTGLADPANMMLQIISDFRLRPLMRLDGVCTTVDAINGAANLDEHEVCRVQAAIADVRIVTKTDLTTADRINRLETRLRKLNRGSRIVRAVQGDADPNDVFGLALVHAETGEADLSRWLNAKGHSTIGSSGQVINSPELHFSGNQHHGADVGTWLIEEPRPVDWDRLSSSIGDILRDYGHLLLRLKGVIRTHGDSRPLVLHGVQRIFHAPVRLKVWPGEECSSIVAIGGKGALPAILELKAALSACVA